MNVGGDIVFHVKRGELTGGGETTREKAILPRDNVFTHERELKMIAAASKGKVATGNVGRLAC